MYELGCQEGCRGTIEKQLFNIKREMGYQHKRSTLWFQHIITGHSPKTMSELEKRKEYWRDREIRKWQMCFFKNGETFFEKMWPLR